MDILKAVLTFWVGYLLILIGDAIFLGRVMHQFIIDKFGALVESTNGSINMNLTAGLTAWFVIVMMIYVFVLKSGYAVSYPSIILWGAIMGFLMYSMYEFTNWTFLKDYPASFVFADIAWGTFLCAAVALAMYAFQIWINKVL